MPCRQSKTANHHLALVIAAGPSVDISIGYASKRDSMDSPVPTLNGRRRLSLLHYFSEAERDFHSHRMTSGFSRHGSHTFDFRISKGNRIDDLLGFIEVMSA